MEKYLKHKLIRILMALSLFIVSLVLPKTDNFSQTPMPPYWWLDVLLVVIAYCLIAYDILWYAVKGLFQGQMLDENFLMALASLGAFAMGEYHEALAVVLFYQVGEFFQSYAVGKSRRSITALMKIRPDRCTLVTEQGDLVDVAAQDVPKGAEIVIKPGERVPLDSEVIKGTSSLDTSALTGEALPREVGKGDALLSGSINLTALLRAKVIRVFAESTATKILDLVENASNKKSRSEQFITRFSRVYTPIVVGLALALALFPPLVLGDGSWQTWLYRALSFLVVSCPCALVVSVPLSFFSGIGAASKRGILVKGSNFLESLAQVKTVVFDKTGTMTQGVFKLQEIVAIRGSREALLFLAAHAESASSHPIAMSLREAYGKNIDPHLVSSVEEHAGKGLLATVDGKQVACGNEKWMQELGLDIQKLGVQKIERLGSVIHVAVVEQYLGYLLIADELREDSQKTVSALRALGVRQLVMLSGDTEASVAETANKLGIKKYYGGLLPAEKLEKLEDYLKKQAQGEKLLFVGDGINDAPVLARADVGVAMGGLGSDAAIEAADVVIMTDEPSRLVSAMKIARKTLRIASQNTYGAIAVKVLVLLLSSLGLASLWWAVFADVGVTFFAVLNAFRVLRWREEEHALGNPCYNERVN